MSCGMQNVGIRNMEPMTMYRSNCGFGGGSGSTEIDVLLNATRAIEICFCKDVCDGVPC